MSTSSDSVLTRSWNVGNGFIGGSASLTHTFPGNGTYPVSLIITTAGGCTDTVQQAVILDQCDTPPACEASFTLSQDTSHTLTYHFQDQSRGMIHAWHWNFGDGSISADRNPSHTFNQTGPYLITLTVEGDSGCLAKDSLALSVTTLLAEKLLAQAVQLYPNPASETFTVDASFTRSISVEWKVWDIRGKLLRQSSQASSGSEFHVQVDLAKLPKGMYVFQLTSQEGILFQKRVVKL